MDKYDLKIMDILNNKGGSCMIQSIMTAFSKEFINESDINIKLSNSLTKLIEADKITCVNPDIGLYRIV